MKRLAVLVGSLLITLPSLAASLGTAARSVIPAEVQQIISVDYRALHNSPTAMDLKAKVLPEAMKQFESSAHSVGIEDQDIEQVTFAAFRTKDGLKMIGVAQGQFPTKAILKKFAAKKIKGEKFHGAAIYPLSSVQMSFLDDYTMVFGDGGALKAALAARDGEGATLNSNAKVTDLITGVETGAIWSVLDTIGTQTMLKSALGDASKIADFDVVKNRLTASRYQMDFNNGVTFDLDVLTADSMSAATLASLLEAYRRLKQGGADGPEKLALESMTVDHSGEQLKLRFKTDDKRFETLMKSELFAAVSR